MKKLLFLPFLQIPSGHHQVADALIDGIKDINPSIQCKKIDILQYSIGQMETVVSSTYLKWIHFSPQTYSWIYHNAVCESTKKENKRYMLFEWLFLHAIKKMLKEEQPDFIICTHGLPSYILSRYKKIMDRPVPVINVYTDFFVHNLWGRSEIDYHFAASPLMKEKLIANGINEQNIFTTGIPTHPEIKAKAEGKMENNLPLSILITGGSLGAGIIEELVKALSSQHIHYYVLCGKNERLFNRLHQLDSGVTPLPYVQSREKMNALYNQADAIITKPGGVTISESIRKQLPIFVYHSLPGQEEINLHQLKQMEVVLDSKDWQTSNDMEEQLLDFFQNKQKKYKLYSKLRALHRHIEYQNPSLLIYKLLQG
ncbi:MGDG synthase family glycosyltransferase [Salibacterium aidingense]|uniref:MGDG synthase family glycosyltransferase n=1 Tax=Salibacterium aidingense TaxID=384933 RepID=UPI0003FFD52F|nr:glycosyltransferase [Salibacterium aidingense]